MKILAILLAVISGFFAISVQAQEISYRIAVIDTGIAIVDATAGHVEAEYDMVNTQAPRDSGKIKNSHGTNVASIILSHAKRPVKIISFRVDSEKNCKEGEGLCQLDTVAIDRALAKAIAMKVDVINLSMDTPYSAQRFIYLQNAARAGIKIVMAAGNNPGPSKMNAYAELVPNNFWIVGALDKQGRKASFSGTPADTTKSSFVWREGVEIKASDRRGNLVEVTGTSFAAPIFAAEFASKP